MLWIAGDAGGKPAAKKAKKYSGAADKGGAEKDGKGPAKLTRSKGPAEEVPEEKPAARCVFGRLLTVSPTVLLFYMTVCTLYVPSGWWNVASRVKTVC